MRILDVSPRVASIGVGGSQRRMTALLDRLARRHDVVQYCQPRLSELRAPGAPRERLNRNPAAALLNEIGERTWPTGPLLSGAGLRLGRRGPLRTLMRWADVTVVEFPWQFGHCARLVPDARLVLSAHNVELDRHASLAVASHARVSLGPWLRHVERVERMAVGRADLIVVVSEADRARMRERYGVDPGKVVVAANGADLHALRRSGPERRLEVRRALGLDERPVVLFAGADVTPNRRGLEWVLKTARLAERFTFLVVGKVGGRPRREGNVVVTGHVPEFEPCLTAADFALCPIEFGAGTKVKLIESLAAGIPTVAFAESLKGLGARDGEHLLVADPSAVSLAAALERLASDRELASSRSVAARRYAAERHDWDRIAAGLESALVELVEPGRASSPSIDSKQSPTDFAEQSPLVP